MWPTGRSKNYSPSGKKGRPNGGVDEKRNDLLRSFSGHPERIQRSPVGRTWGELIGAGKKPARQGESTIPEAGKIRKRHAEDRLHQRSVQGTERKERAIKEGSQETNDYQLFCGAGGLVYSWGTLALGGTS